MTSSAPRHGDDAPMAAVASTAVPAAPQSGEAPFYGGAASLPQPPSPQPDAQRAAALGTAARRAPGHGPLRTHHLREMKARGEKITAITCYDATFARLVDAADVDVVLVGDSLGNVVQGQASTLPVTLDDILYHTRAVARGLQRAHLVADMPFMTYWSPEVALPNAGRLLAEGGAHAVKLEGGAEVAATVARLVAAGIPVMGHIGLTPQSVHALGGHRVQGRGASARARLLRDARALQEAGCYAIVLEGIPRRLAAEISAALEVPTIGIGAGEACDGQILVLYDMLGLNPGFNPKFLKLFAELGHGVREALAAYRDEVRAGSFPGPEHGYEDEGGRQPKLAVAR